MADACFCCSLTRREGPIDLEAKFEPSLLNTAIYLLGLSQQVSTFAINFQGRPFREGITENSALYWGLLGAAGVAFSGATDFIPELNRPLQIVEMELPVRFRSSQAPHSGHPSIYCAKLPNSNIPFLLLQFKLRLTLTMIGDFIGCWLIEVVCKWLFADLAPKPIVTRGRERREARRAVELKEKMELQRAEQAKIENEKAQKLEGEVVKLESRKNR